MQLETVRSATRLGECTPSDDERLLRQTAAGDNGAFATLVRCHQAKVIRLAGRLLGSAQPAEDVAQEAFLRVYQHAGRFEPRAKFTTWLYRVVVNLCLDERRRWQHRPRNASAEPLSEPGLTSLELSELQERVHRAIDLLPPRQRAVLVLHRFEELTIREIAHVTECTESAVESLLVRAYEHLRESLRGVQDR